MRTFFKYLFCLAVATVFVGCEAFDLDLAPKDPGINDQRPTTPIKRRPIVPTTKLPRPRVIENVDLFGSKLSVVTSNVSNESIILELRSVTTNQVWSVESFGSVVEFDIQDASSDYILMVQTRDETYVENILIE